MKRKTRDGGWSHRRFPNPPRFLVFLLVAERIVKNKNSKRKIYRDNANMSNEGSEGSGPKVSKGPFLLAPGEPVPNN